MPITGLSLTHVPTYDIYDVGSSERAQDAVIDGETVIIRGGSGQIRPLQTLVTGTAEITSSVTVDATNNKLLVLIDNEDEVEITLTTGSRTLAQIVADLNSALTGTPVNQFNNRVRFNVDFRVDIRTIANDAYTLLGLTVANTSNRILIKESQIRIHDDVSQNLDHNGAPLTYQYGTAGEGGRSEQSRLEMENSTVTLQALDARRSMQFSAIRNSVIKEEGDNTRTFVYTSIGCELDDVVLFGIGQWELNGNPASASDITLDSCDAGPTNWQAGRLDLTGLDILNVRADGQHARLGNGNSGNNFFWFWNPTTNIDFGKMFRQNATCGAFRGYTYFPEFIDANGVIDGATLIYRDDRATTGTFVVRGTYTTGSDGRLDGIHNSKDGTDEATSVDQDVLWLLTDLTVDNDPSGQYPEVTLVSGTRSYRQYDIQVVTPRLEFRSYGHLPLNGYGEEDDFEIDAAQGSINADGSGDQPAAVFVSIDESVTEADRDTVDAYTELDNAAEAYDFLKSLWKTDGDKGTAGTYCDKDGDVLDFGARDVTLSTTASDVAAVDASGNVTLKTGEEFDGSFQTTGTVTVGHGINVTGSIQDSTGITVIISGLPAAHDAVVGAWPQSDGETDRTNIVNGKIPIIHRDDISVTGSTRTVSTVAGDFSIFRVGSTVKLFRFDEDRQQWQLRGRVRRGPTACLWF